MPLATDCFAGRGLQCKLVKYEITVMLCQNQAQRSLCYSTMLKSDNEASSGSFFIMQSEESMAGVDDRPGTLILSMLATAGEGRSSVSDEAMLVLLSASSAFCALDFVASSSVLVLA